MRRSLPASSALSLRKRSTIELAIAVWRNANVNYGEVGRNCFGRNCPPCNARRSERSVRETVLAPRMDREGRRPAKKIRLGWPWCDSPVVFETRLVERRHGYDVHQDHVNRER